MSSVRNMDLTLPKAASWKAALVAAKKITHAKGAIDVMRACVNVEIWISFVELMHQNLIAYIDLRVKKIPRNLNLRPKQKI